MTQTSDQMQNPASRIQKWEIFHKGQCIDTVFTGSTETAVDVLHSLVNHDHYPSDIRVQKAT